LRRVLGVALFLPALAGAACGTQAGAYPLYAKVGTGPGPAKVAMLHGPIQTVDDQNVASKGQTFELLPGCHIVTLQKSVGAGSANGAWAANLPQLVVAFYMKPAHRYMINTEIPDTSAPVGRFYIFASEKAPDGTVVRVPFARSDEDILNCKRWAESQGN
jgi:hypothetical protein